MQKSDLSFFCLFGVLTNFIAKSLFVRYVIIAMYDSDKHLFTEKDIFYVKQK